MKRRTLWLLAIALAAAVVVTGVAAAPPASPALTAVATANPRATGYAPANALSPELQQVIVAQGGTKVENPTASISTYGYDNDVVDELGLPAMVPGGAFPATEAHKTEPDKNTYLVLKGQQGADPSYDYGTHFLFQGHETGTPGVITRINLDADAAHRVTVLATTDSTAAPLADIDGSTWDPFAQRLLFTTENANAPTYAATASYPSTVTDVSGALGRGGFEGIQDDSAGTIWIVEDIGGPAKPSTTAKRPNSFVYRYVPSAPGDLANGKLEALQVLNAANAPITFESQAALNSPDQLALHTYGASFKTKWVVVHDTAVNGTAPFNASTAAKAAQATPFKRPENGQFRPDSKFTEFYFDETGDTNATSPENDTAGGWGSVFKLTQQSVKSDDGTLTIFYKANEATAAFDNVTFLSRDSVTFVQDAGDTLHQQANALDSGWVFDVRKDYSNASNQPLRWLAEGRDASATLDAGNAGFGKNEGDNEITGVHVSDGDPTKEGILGTKAPELGNGKWRWFWTQQHGDNFTWEVTVAGKHGHDD
jgi:hypothetical protein